MLAKKPSKSGVRGSSTSPNLKRIGAKRGDVTSKSQKPSKGVAKAKGNSIGKAHSFKEGTPAHKLAKRALKSVYRAKNDNGAGLAKLHTKNAPKKYVGPSARPGGKGKPQFSSFGY